MLKLLALQLLPLFIKLLKFAFVVGGTIGLLFLLKYLFYEYIPSQSKLWFLAGYFLGIGFSCVVHRLEYGFWPTQKMPTTPPNY